jgi:hypothetical protein
MSAYGSVNDDHSDPRQIAFFYAVEQVLPGGVLRLIHQNERCLSPRSDQTTIEISNPGSVSGGETENLFRGNIAKR